MMVSMSCRLVSFCLARLVASVAESVSILSWCLWSFQYLFWLLQCRVAALLGMKFRGYPDWFCSRVGSLVVWRASVLCADFPLISGVGRRESY